MDSYSWRGAMFASWAVSGAISSFASFVCLPQVSLAQNAIAPDKTLPVNTVVNFDSANKTYTITGGTQVGANQFHSFQDLSVPTANTAHFDNALTTTNVIGRVTGSNISNIDGTLRTNGTASLYLINPNGIIFGANAKLDIGGSFSASTANSFKFPDGSEFSATNPQAPPLLQVNTPLGLQYGKSNPAPITNAGNLSVGQNLTLSGGSVTSTGSLSAPKGNLRLEAVAGDVTATQFQAGTATLSATQGILLENGKFQTSGDLNLLAKDSVVIQDSATKPLNLQVGGDLLVQGDRAVTVNTLAHPDSSLWVGKNVLLRSDNPIAIDAHWNAGGNFRSEKLDGSLGDLYSPNDPIFQFGGDLFFGNYTGASLQVLAGGSLAFGTIQITGSGTPFNDSAVNLSDESSLIVNGTTRPVVDIRAGVLPSAFFLSNVISTGNPTGASIFIDSIAFSNNTIAGSNGLVFLTNQFAPNNALVGDVFIREISTANFSENAGSVVIDSKRDITLTNQINAVSVLNGGAVKLLANGNLTVAGISTISAYANAGNVSLLSRNGNIDTRSGDINAYADASLNGISGGKVTLTAGLDVLSGSINTSGGKRGGGNDIAIKANSVSIPNGSLLDASTYGQGNGGNIIIDADLVSFDNGAAFSNVNSSAVGKSGNVTIINAREVSFTNGAALSSSTLGKGDAGNVTIIATDLVSFDNSGALSAVGKSAVGNAGNVSINARSLNLTNGALLSSSTYGQGKAGNITITAIDSAFFSGININSGISSGAASDVNSGAVGKAGNVTINAGSLTVKNGAQISSSTSAIGDAGNITITTNDSVSFSGASIFSFAGKDKVISSGVFSVVNPNAVGYGGTVSIKAGSISITDGAVLSSVTGGKGNAGDVNINATGSVLFSGINNINGEPSRAVSNVELGVVDDAGNVELGAVGKAGNVTINAGSLTVKNGAQISSSTSAIGDAGNITITTNDSVSFSGASIFSFAGIDNVISSGAFSTVDPKAVGNGGTVSVKASSISITDGAVLSSGTFGQGNAGNITITAIDTVSFANFGRAGSIVGDSALGSGGNVTINADSLSFTNGAELSSRTDSSGNAGSIRVILGKSLTLDGDSAIFAGTSPSSTGDGGSIFIDPPNINLLNGSGISVSSLGSGVGGNIAIVADNLTLSNGSYITSETKSNNGGNLNLDVSSILLLRYGSGISTTAGFADAGGNGGDITINAGFIVGVPIENSDITANAFTGNGGKVTIFTNGIYGLQYRSQRTPLSDITASSKYGVQGTVNINTPDADPSKGLSNLPANVSDPSRLVKERCSADRRGSEFIITGKGGVPANPSDRPTDTGVLDNFGTLPDRHQTANRTSSATPQPTTTPDRTPDRIVEATGWIVNAQNQVVLVAGTTPAQHNIPCPR